MKPILLLLILLTAHAELFAQAANSDIRAGNDYYSRRLYSNAATAYQDGLKADPASFDAAFNLGDALYRQKKFEEAAKQFEAITHIAPNNDKLAQLYHNLGNAYLQGNDLPKSIASYKNALKLNPNDNDTRYNLMYAQQLLDMSQKNQQNGQDKQNQDQQQDKDKKDQDQGQGQNQDNKNDQSNSNDADGDGIPDKKEQGNDSKNPTDTDKDKTPDYRDTDSDGDGSSDKEEAGQNPKEPQDTDKDGKPDFQDTDSDNDGKPDSEEKKNNQDASKINAARLLDALETQEAQLQNKMNQQRGQRVNIEKDW